MKTCHSDLLLQGAHLTDRTRGCALNLSLFVPKSSWTTPSQRLCVSRVLRQAYQVGNFCEVVLAPELSTGLLQTLEISWRLRIFLPSFPFSLSPLPWSDMNCILKVPPVSPAAFPFSLIDLFLNTSLSRLHLSWCLLLREPKLTHTGTEYSLSSVLRT